MSTAIWLDDIRDPRSYQDLLETYAPGVKVIWVQSYDEFVEVVTETPDLCAVFFDNDLGAHRSERKDGTHAFTWFEGWVRENGHPRVELYAQTANSAAKKELNGGFASLRRFWDVQEQEGKCHDRDI